jgi:hypothetical protein
MMDAESLLNLKSDEAAASARLKGSGGELIRESASSGVYWALMRPRLQPNEEYFVRIGWSRYPHSPPSVKFSDKVGGYLNLTNAWPVIKGYRPGSFDICKPFTAEGFAVHPEWSNGPDGWSSSGNPFLWVIEILQNDLDNNYTGRST